MRTGEDTPEYDYDMPIYFKLEGVNMETGETFIIDVVRDLKKGVINIECRKCHNQHSWKES